MVGVRLPAPIVRKIDKMAAEIGTDRSMVIRLMVEYVLDIGPPEVQTMRSLLITSLRGWRGRGRAADKIAGTVLENLKACAAEYLAAQRTARKKRGADVVSGQEKRPERLATAKI